MMFLVLALALLVTVYGQDPDPTKVCLPDVLQLNARSLYTNVSGVFAYNFPAKTIAVRLSYGVRAVYNLTDNTVSNFKDGSCNKFSTGILDTYHFAILSQCLPAGAKLLTPDNTHLGLSPASLDIEAWEIDTGDLAIPRIAVTKSSPAVPVIIQSDFKNPPATGNDPIPEGAVTGTMPKDIKLMVNAKASIDDSSIFDVPDDCKDMTL